MLRTITCAALAVALAAPALAQKPITKPPVESILFWTPKQQLERYPAIETVYAVNTIKKGDKVHELPLAPAQINPKITVGSKTSAIDAFMKDNRITGVIAALKRMASALRARNWSDAARTSPLPGESPGW